LFFRGVIRYNNNWYYSAKKADCRELRSLAAKTGLFTNDSWNQAKNQICLPPKSILFCYLRYKSYQTNQPCVLTASQTKFLGTGFARPRAWRAAVRNVAIVLLLASQNEKLEYGKWCFLHNSLMRGDMSLRLHRGSRGKRWCST
jgi:hypothetical protein